MTSRWSRNFSRVLIVPKILGTDAGRDVFQHDWETEGRDHHHVDFVTDDLASFVRDVGDVVGEKPV